LLGVLAAIAYVFRLIGGNFASRFQVSLRTSAWPNHPIRIRLGTADFTVLYATIVESFHLPPAVRSAPRVVIDLGANIGLTMVDFAHRYPSARIVGVEMDAANAELCRVNVMPFGARCTVIQGAVWTHDGEVAYQGMTEDGYQINERSAGRVTRAYTIERLLTELGIEQVDLMKMDIEGAEERILPAAGNWIHRVNCLVIEVHAPMEPSHCTELLGKWGFETQLSSQHKNGVIAFRRDTPAS